MGTAILIPVYKPDEKLVALVKALSETDVARIVIVNDGSPVEFDPIFKTIQGISTTIDLLSHAVNQGKGAALRTGFRHIDTLPEMIASIITADADGQHSVKDILAVAEETLRHPGTLILGSRQFDKDVPPRSMFGNTTTRWVIRLFFGLRIWDTQTGLRGIPRKALPFIYQIPYDRYELELLMLLLCKKNHIPVREIPIETIYIEKNRSSHFNPLLDSARVYWMLIRYALTSLVQNEPDHLYRA
ncbi:MAG: glycosyltransferase family 2 protein [Anaerolineales bacterium]|nr:glycosyltransferase family 2 protein [Anaerolineales bacterium]